MIVLKFEIFGFDFEKRGNKKDTNTLLVIVYNINEKYHNNQTSIKK